MFEDLLEANRRYSSEFHQSGEAGIAAKGLAVLTCIDSRIDPLALMGLRAGDAKIIRNAGARATTDALRSLILAANLLGVTRICVVQHTDCAVVGSTEEAIKARIATARGIDASAWDFMASTDQMATLRQDMDAIRSCPLLPSDIELATFIFNVHTGELMVVDLGDDAPI